MTITLYTEIVVYWKVRLCYGASFNLTSNVRSLRSNDLSLITSKPNNYFSKLEEVVINNNFKRNEELESFADNYCEKINKLELIMKRVFI